LIIIFVDQIKQKEKPAMSNEKIYENVPVVRNQLASSASG